MIQMTRRAAMQASAVTLASQAIPAWAANVHILGGGSSFVRPVMLRWTEAARAHGMDVTYVVLGTGEAQNQVLAGDIDFAAVELPMSRNRLEMGELVQFPVAFGAMTFVVNIEGFGDGALKLNAVLLGGIYSGDIKTWNDPRIVAANPDLALPDIEIHPVFLGRPDGSAYSTSTTLVRYLMANNADWAQKFSNGIKTRWAMGSMVPSAAAMIPVVKARQGGIGYMSLGTAMGTQLPKIKIQNKNGETMMASHDSLRAAIAKVDWGAAPDLVVNATDLSGAGVWPLVLPTYGFMSRAPRNKDRGKLVRAFLSYALQEGPAEASNAVALPAEARDRVLELLATA